MSASTPHRAPTATSLIVDQLGGNTAVAAICGVKPSAVSMWKMSETFPSKYYVAMRRAMWDRGIACPPALFGMVEPQQEAAE